MFILKVVSYIFSNCKLCDGFTRNTILCCLLIFYSNHDIYDAVYIIKHVIPNINFIKELLKMDEHPQYLLDMIYDRTGI